MSNAVLPWQEKDWSRLSNHVYQKTLPHAFLFSGLKGLGKLTFAQQLAALVLCEKVQQNLGHTCGHCKQCKLFFSETHPDFKMIMPEEGSASIKVDQIRQLVEFFAQSSQQGGYKVAILTPAEMLNVNAANALLKTLEEPSSRSLIILVSHQAGLLLPTIRSRCQVVDFLLPPVAQAKSWLGSELKQQTESVFTEDDLNLALTLSNSAPLTALNYLTQGLLEEYRRMLDELSSLLKNEALASEIATRWNDDFANLRLSWTMVWLQEIVKQKFGESIKDSHAAQKMFVYLAEKTPADVLDKLYQTSLEQYRLFIGTSNPNKVLAFEMLLNNWLSLMKKS